MIRRPRRPTLFPYTTLSRAAVVEGLAEHVGVPQVADEDLEGGRRRHRQQEAEEPAQGAAGEQGDRKSTRLNSSHANISYAVFCLKKKNTSKFTSSHSTPDIN